MDLIGLDKKKLRDFLYFDKGFIENNEEILLWLDKN